MWRAKRRRPKKERRNRNEWGGKNQPCGRRICWSAMAFEDGLRLLVKTGPWTVWRRLAGWIRWEKQSDVRRVERTPTANVKNETDDQDQEYGRSGARMNMGQTRMLPRQREARKGKISVQLVRASGSGNDDDDDGKRETGREYEQRGGE